MGRAYRMNKPVKYVKSICFNCGSYRIRITESESGAYCDFHETYFPNQNGGASGTRPGDRTCNNWESKYQRRKNHGDKKDETT